MSHASITISVVPGNAESDAYASISVIGGGGPERRALAAAGQAILAALEGADDDVGDALARLRDELVVLLRGAG